MLEEKHDDGSEEESESEGGDLLDKLLGRRTDTDRKRLIEAIEGRGNTISNPKDDNEALEPQEETMESKIKQKE